MTPPADAPPRDEPPAGLGWAVVSAAAWFAVVVAHFFVCAKLAHWLGSPGNLPPSWRTLDELFSHGISTGLHLLVAMLWWTTVLVTLGLLALAGFAAQGLLPARSRPAVIEGMIAAVPVAAITLLTLLILPFESHHAVDEPTGLELADALSFDAFLETLLAGLFAILAILVLFVGLFAAVAFFMRWPMFNDIVELILAILFGIACAIAFGFAVGPAVLGLGERIGTARAIVAFLALCGLLTAPLALAMARSPGTPSEKGSP